VFVSSMILFRRVVSILPNKMIGVVGEHADYPIERLGEVMQHISIVGSRNTFISSFSSYFEDSGACLIHELNVRQVLKVSIWLTQDFCSIVQHFQVTRVFWGARHTIIL
jgi:hypothetical protein